MAGEYVSQMRVVRRCWWKPHVGWAFGFGALFMLVPSLFASIGLAQETLATGWVSFGAVPLFSIAWFWILTALYWMGHSNIYHRFGWYFGMGALHVFLALLMGGFTATVLVSIVNFGGV